MAGIIRGEQHDPSLLMRFEQKYVPEPNSGCWLWTANIVNSGTIKTDKYLRPVIYCDGKPRRAHRVAFELFKGEIPEGALICHTCNNNFCVNPDHLYAGTNQSNTDDMMRAGRHYANTSGGRAILLANVRKIHARRRNDTHCKRGHPLSGDNLYIIASSGSRSCKTCGRARSRVYMASKRARNRS